MPTPRALTALQATNSLVNRLGTRVVDRVRQIATNKGLRPYRVWLVWSTWDGEERGAGTETEISRLEILPTPKVVNLDSIAMNPAAAGMIPMGSIRVEKISVSLNLDTLKGRTVPTNPEQHIPKNISFHWEVREDGRGGETTPEVMKFRLAADPFRRAGRADWSATLERVDLTSETT